MPSVDELLSLREAADRSDVSTSRLRRLAKAGTLRAQRVGRDWVVARSDLEAFMRIERPRGVSAAARARRVQDQERHDT
jgi:excisionase family DNA binding protein